ncbi:MAG: glutaminyl-peptide cyclotransferase [Pseudomonadota bacterium]
MKQTFGGCSRQMGFKKLIIISAILLTFSLPSLSETAAQPLLAPDRAMDIPVYSYRVINVYPHDRQASTQGLIYCDGFLYESTGRNGKSALRRVRLETGKVLEQHRLAREYFGEGLTDWGENLFQVTWQSNVGFVYDKATLRVKRTFHYPGEGWGLAHDQTRLIMSDGTATLRFFDPDTLKETGRLTVREGHLPLEYLNELEFIRGEIYANVWETDKIARISPYTGQVTGWIDLHGLLPGIDKMIRVGVLNGIAYDSRKNRLFVTGKLWPKLFEIVLVGRE